MKALIKKIGTIIIYFFTPEDSATPIRTGYLSFNIESDVIGIGSVKALFWVMNTMIFMYLISLL
jgi:hypothetical protein